MTLSELKEKRLLTTEEAAIYIGISKANLQTIISRGNFTPLIRIGRGRGRVFINREKLDIWLDEQDGSYKNL